MSANMDAIVIAVRGGPDAKTRLAPALDARERAELSALMLDAMLSTLSSADALLYVVSPTLTLQALARSYGARVIAQAPNDGLNAAFRAGCNAAFGDGAEVTACLPGDLPVARWPELQAVLKTARTHGAAIVRSHSDDGTGALCLRKGTKLDPAFGPASFEKHNAQARAYGVAIPEVAAPSLAFDIDTPADLARLFERAPHPTSLLRRLQEICPNKMAGAA